MDVKEKKRKEIKIVNVCVCMCFIFFILFYIFYFFNDKIADIKEEFNILIGSRLRIINLYVSDILISDEKTIIKTSLTRQKSRSSLPQVGCVRGANTFPNHNQSLTRESLTRPVHPVS